jgi:asparagine synthase (glutamine-hydrolysing)
MLMRSTAAPIRSADFAGARLTRAADEGPLSRDAERRRARVRIGGIVCRDSVEGEALLTSRLGPGALLLGDADDAIVADFDSCWLDGRRLDDLSEWRGLLAGGRLAAVNGAFAVAWRSDGGTVSLARDSIGERSLFYAVIPGGFVFASTLEGILATGLARTEIDLASVARYLSYAYVPGRDSMIAGIRKVLPGEVVRYRAGAITSESYWSLPPEPESYAGVSERDLRDRLRAALENGVRRRLPSAGPVGATLSGGIDSSLVVALARQLHPDELITYSISFGPDYPNELAFSSMVAEHCRTRHRVVELSPAVILRYLDESIAMLGDPIGDPLTVPNALLFREAANDVEVVLNGEGGDPCFGGPKNIPMLLAELFGDGAEQGSAGRELSRERSYLRAHQKCHDELPDMLTPDARAAMAGELLERQVEPWFSDPRWKSFVVKLMALNVAFKGSDHILHKIDALSAPFGAIARSPLFDRDVVDLAFEIPPQLKLRGSIEKYLLKEAVRDLLPSTIIDRPKSGMLVPVEGWFKGPLESHARERLLDGLAPYGLFQRDYLERLLDGRLPGLRPRRGVKIWLLVTLESWLRSIK